MRSTICAGWASAIATCAVASHALALEPPDPEPADSAELPVAFVERPLTLPGVTLAPRVGFSAQHVDLGDGGGLFDLSYTAFLLEAGLDVGIVDDFMVEVTPLSLVFGDVETDYGAFRLGAVFRFLDLSAVEMAARFRFFLDSGKNIVLNPGIPMRIHGGDIVRVDTGINVGVFVPDEGDVFAGFATASPLLLLNSAGIPLDVTFQIADPAFVGASTGFGLATFEDSDSIFIPLGFRAGGTIPGDSGPIGDISAAFSFPAFGLPAAEDPVVTEIWNLSFGAQFFIGL